MILTSPLLHRVHLPIYIDESCCPCVPPHRLGTDCIGGEVLGANRDSVNIICLLLSLGHPPHVIPRERCLARGNYWQLCIRATLVRKGQSSKSEEADSVVIFSVGDVPIV